MGIYSLTLNSEGDKIFKMVSAEDEEVIYSNPINIEKRMLTAYIKDVEKEMKKTLYDNTSI
jgi:hypothetical protein